VVGLTQPVEPRSQLLVEDRDLAVEHQRADNFAMAAGMLRNRRVWSRPFLLIKRTRSPSLYARMRQPSTFSSYTQPSRWNGARTRVGAIGVY